MAWLELTAYFFGRGVPLCPLSSTCWRCRLIESPITQHRIQHITASAGERDERLVVSFALADFAVLVSPGDGIAQGGESRQEHRTF